MMNEIRFIDLVYANSLHYVTGLSIVLVVMQQAFKNLVLVPLL